MATDQTLTPELVSPSHTVLLVHEMLNAFVAEGGAFDTDGRRIDVSSIVPPMVELIRAARSAGVRVAYVKWTTWPDGSTTNRATGLEPDEEQVDPTATDTTIDSTWGWEVLDAVKPEPGDWQLRKYRPDAFFATAVDAFLRWNRIKTLVVVGVGAEVGIIPTLMTASNLGYRRVVASNCIRPTDPKRMDDALLYIHDHAVVRPHSDIIAAWANS